ncbi:MAG: hypothetical protein LC126_12415 [Bryobacterales bacterium]|nr:hypothetical protein [Bryobacterales bacterium]
MRNRKAEACDTSVSRLELGAFEMPRHFRAGAGGKTATLLPSLERLGAALDEFGGGA